MKSSTGKYYLGIDQIRGVAALTIFIWHFSVIHDGYKSGPVLFPLNVLAEGHTGVALFMCLSGYLFAKLLENKRIFYWKFIYNRLLRLLPLLATVIAIKALILIKSNAFSMDFFHPILTGLILPSLPNGGWSITVELHFYLLFPLLLIIHRKTKSIFWIVTVIAIILRLMLYVHSGEIQHLAYWTLIGRIDQFMLGIIGFQLRHMIKNNQKLIIISSSLFFSFYYYFDHLGGFFSFPSYPSPSPLWIIMPSIEGLFYAVFISWFDNSIKASNSWLGKLLANAGKYSYSIYLLHFFIVFDLATFIDKNIIDLSNPYVAMISAVICFPIMIPIGYLSFKLIESPFLKYRIKYYQD